jgi:pSer/pThr/pTyr-binding forkhead associated (FHA) protein
MTSYGKLVQIQDGDPALEFELNKTRVSIGRGMTSDITLQDARVSRDHARLDCGPAGCTLVDLGSSNGTRVNGLPVEKHTLAPGDTIILGGSTLRFERAALSETPQATVIDSLVDFEATMAQEIVPMVLNETSQPRLVVFTDERTWEVPLGQVERLTIGRAAENDLMLEQARVSRRHAEVRRTGDFFTFKDLGSTNGSWLRDQALQEIVLQDGDMLRLGAARLVFKQGFSEAALTMVDEQIHAHPGRVPIVFVPGFMGSELWLGSERVWPNVKWMFKDPDLFKYSPEDTRLEARGIVDQVVIVPNLIKQDQYNRLGDYLVEDLGYARGIDFFEFAYDWRQDVRQSARQLAQFVSELPVVGPVFIIAHSLGTQVARYYVERVGGVDRVQRLLLLGGPHRGVPKALTSLLVAPELLPSGLMGDKLRQVIATYPSSYQILPVYPCAIDQQGEKINFLENDFWLPEEHRPLLHNAREFRRELGYQTSVPTISIFGYGLKTIAGISLQRLERSISNIIYRQEPSGDNTIPQNSAVLEGTEIHPVQQHHGSLFVDQDVKMRMKLELTRVV